MTFRATTILAALAAAFVAACATSPEAPQGKVMALGAPPAMANAPAPKEGLLGADQGCGPSGNWFPLTLVNNDTTRSMWVTYYDRFPNSFNSTEIVYTACLKPLERRMACIDYREYIIRAEMVSRTDRAVATDCSTGGVTCDTEQIAGALVHLKYNRPGPMTVTMQPQPGGGCRWDPYESPRVR